MALPEQQKTTKNYVPAKDIEAEYQASISLGQPTDKLLVMFKKIATGFISTYNPRNVTDKNACINYAVSEAWRKWDKYNPERSDNVFSFYTTMIANDLRNHYKEITKGKSRNISIDALFSNQNN